MRKRIKKNRLYKELAWLWPIISPPEEYIKETEFLIKVIKKHFKRKVKTLLHLGCGGGHNDNVFKRHFEVTGVDVSPNMLKLARKLNPTVKYIKGDMRTTHLKKQFDAVAVLDSISYMLNEKDLLRALKVAYEHLKPGGVFLAMVESEKGFFRQNKTYTSTYAKGNTEVTYVENHYDPNPKDTTYEATFVYLIRQKRKLKIQLDQHTVGIFKLNTWLRLLKKVGFKVKVLKFKHPAFERGFCPMLVCQKVKKRR